MALQLFDLCHKGIRIEHNTIADNGELARADDTRGQERELINLVANDERVASIMPALEAHDRIGLFTQPIDQLAFTFVAPLGADDHHIRHGSLSDRTLRVTKATLNAKAPARPGLAADPYLIGGLTARKQGG